MKTAKVQEITKVNEWKWPNGTIFYINMKMDNGELINLWKKKADAFKVGDTINYDSFEENGKTKFKEVKENPFKPKAYNPEATNKGAMIWMAFKLAFEVMYDKKSENYSDTVALAVRIYEDAMDLYNKGEKSESKEEENDDVNLPF